MYHATSSPVGRSASVQAPLRLRGSEDYNEGLEHLSHDLSGKLVDFLKEQQGKVNLQ